MSIVEFINLHSQDDNRGSLIAIESNQDIPFNIERVYYLFNTSEDAARGFHAHKDLQQLAICVSGKCRMTLDDGTKKESVVLDSPTKGLLIKSNIWREIDSFSKDCVLLVLANHKYDEDDYIRDYQDFLRYMKC